ncbi:MAG: XRE family transcriptional regulator [Puniceicoccaceae bacterium]|nr:MAG: XRE family transcriptional regulator [Puniceicoccaceae bacterium]
MGFPERVVTLRKRKRFTQRALAEAIGLNVSQLKRYEAGTSQPTLEVLRRLSIALGVSSDTIVFDENERGPDDELRLQFEAISRFDPEERKVVKALLDSLILKHESRRWSAE